VNYEERLKNVSVLGAAGKMGSGIVLLTAMEMADLSLKSEGRQGNGVLNAIDVSPVSLSGLYGYLKIQIKKAAEKKIVLLRQFYKDNADLIENSEIIDQYVDDVMKLILYSARIESAYDSKLIFEAIVEDSEIKTGIMKQILKNNKNDPWFLTNTSSVPIGELDSGASLSGKIIGFHFYNPPAVQKLVELITTRNTDSELIGFSQTFAKNLNKRVVPANDYAGFIGNGHFMRDLLYGIRQADKLAKEISFIESVYAINTISQDFLIRPMGIFQLMDYVGVDVCQKILQVMKSRLKDDNLHSSLIDKLIESGISGGQNPDGSQKPGILYYEWGKPVAVFDLLKKDYIPVESFKSALENLLGKLPQSHKPWKDVIGNSQKEGYLKNYFRELKESGTPGSELAMNYYFNSKNIGLNLVKNGIADNSENVNTVLLTGFFHAYGPINDYLD
jgi:3-hydroxyacyl-CoA dehydrogenase